MRKLAFLFLLPVMLSAQQRSFINLGIEQGLAQSQVNMVHQDAKGYLWIATIGGLSRYDGHEFRNYYKNQGLFDNDVSTILELEDGTLIFGCLGGMSIFDGRSFQSVSLPDNLIQFNISCMDQLTEDSIWMGTNGGGHLTFNLHSHEFSEPDLKAGSNIRWLESTTNLVSTDDGLFKNGVLLHEIFRNVTVTDVELYQGKLWVSSPRDGLFVFDETWKQLDGPEQEYLSNVRHMFAASDGSLWFATRNGAICFQEGKWLRFFEENGLPYQNIRSISEDREGNIWLATNGQGIFRYVGDLFTTYTSGAPLQSEILLSMIEVGDKLYMGMFNEGLQIMQADGTCLMVRDIPQTDVWAQFVDAHKRHWIGTSIGLYLGEANGFKEVFSEELPNRRITSLTQNKNGDLYIGHKEGVSLLYGDKFIANPLPPNSISPKRVRAMAFDEKGRLFLGAENGLFIFDQGTLKAFTESDGLTDNTVYALCPDAQGRMWVGTKAGLMYFSGNDKLTAIPLDTESGPQNINFILFSEAQQLYIGTNQGLFKSKEEGTDIYFYRYGITEGLPSLESNLNAVFQERKGDIYFGTSKGIVRFNEDKMIDQSDHLPPFLHIMKVALWAEDISLEGREFQEVDSDGLAQGLILNSKENHLTFEFVGVRLADPKSVRYRYRLMGVDEQWSPITESNVVTYSSLSPGDYIFQVNTVNERGMIDSSTKEYAFTILAPWYMRPWALAMEASALGLIFFFFYKGQLREAEKKRERVELGYKNRMYALEQQSLNSSMNRHFIFNALNAIQYYINKEEKRAANKYLTSFAKLIRKNLDSTADIWVSLHDELERLELYLGLEQMRFSDRFTYHIHVEEGLDSESIKVPAMTLQPYLENSIWHGILPKDIPGQVKVVINRVENRLRIIIEDDGIGIDTSLSRKSNMMKDHESKGLQITDDRIQLFSKITGLQFDIKGPYQLEKEGAILGTRTEIYIPI